MKRLVCLFLTVLLLTGCAAPVTPPDDALPESTPEAAAPAAPESTPSKAPVNTAPQLPEYTPSGWQVTAEQNRYALSPQQRMEAAAAKFDHAQCRTLQITEICLDDLDEEQRAHVQSLVSGDLFYVTFFRAEDGRIFFCERDTYFLLAGCYGVNDLAMPLGRFQTYMMYYEGELPENGKLDEACIRSIEYIHLPSATGLRDTWYEAMRTAPDILLYGHEEALDHYLRRMGWQGFEKLRDENGAEYYSNGTVDILAANYDQVSPLTWYSFLIFPAGQREQETDNYFYVSVYIDGRIDEYAYNTGIELVRRYGISVGQPTETPINFADQIITGKYGQTQLDSHWDADTAAADTLDKGRWLLRMAHVHEPDLTAGEMQQADLLFIREYGLTESNFAHNTAEPYLNSILLLSRDTAILQPDFGRHARQLALWQDEGDPDRLWIAFQDVTQPADAPWDILGWDGAGRWLEKQLELSALWRNSAAGESIDCTDVDCICRSLSAHWYASAAVKGGNVQHSRSGMDDAADRLAKKLLFLALHIGGDPATSAQDPATLAAAFVDWQQTDGERYSYTVPDEPPVQDSFYLQTDPTAAAAHGLPAQLLAWVEPDAPDTLLVSTCTDGTWQTVTYPGWGAWLHYDLVIGAIGLP